MPRWRQVCTRPRSLVSGDRPTKSEFPRKVASSACNVRVDDVLFLPDPVPMMRSDRGAFSHSAINLRTNTVAAVADGDGAGRDLRLRVDHPPPTAIAAAAAPAVNGFENSCMLSSFQAEQRRRGQDRPAHALADVKERELQSRAGDVNRPRQRAPTAAVGPPWLWPSFFRVLQAHFSVRAGFRSASAVCRRFARLRPMSVRIVICGSIRVNHL